MIISLSQSTSTIHRSNSIITEQQRYSPSKSLVSPSLSTPKNNTIFLVISNSKPLHASSIQNFGSNRALECDHVVCKAYEADQSEGECVVDKTKAAKRWWILDVIFDIYNNKMENTPLHVAASRNDVEVVKFLLNSTGPETVDLEAMNLFQETPLHLAAKNGCNEVVELLLSHGAFIEAESINGMTPLHASLWHSLKAKDNSTVETLLRHNANCSAKDNEGKTPMDHVSQGTKSEKLEALLNTYLEEAQRKLRDIEEENRKRIAIEKEEQRKRKDIEARRETKAKMDEVEKELSNIVGLHELKLQIRNWAKGMLLHERRRALGLNVQTRRPPHFVFLGNPGTGKTMIARILGKLLCLVGVLPTNKVKEVQRTDLVGEYIGQTGPKARSVLKEAKGGILFVDEAYRLIPYQISVKTIADLIESETAEDQRKEMNGGLVDHLLVNAKEHLDSRLGLDCWDIEELLTITLEDLEVPALRSGPPVIPQAAEFNERKLWLSEASVVAKVNAVKASVITQMQLSSIVHAVLSALQKKQTNHSSVSSPHLSYHIYPQKNP
ncbi:hypothetical protein QVD17_16120 [Tagetes erecta]|uniref:AAA+ ATPase domain-containing protein n=1 Tax=Tagetes erecta TaxID=13708 RepID=A0AAD8KRJ0_TARER|nr:hypothetical protein QVD17_16120 [Tagetes erecta]